VSLPTSKHLQLPLPGAPQRTNSFPATMALSPDGRYAALLNSGYGTVDSGIRQSIAILDLESSVLTDFPDDRLAENTHQTYFLGLAFSGDGQHLYASMASLTDPTGKLPGSTGNGIAVYRFDHGKVAPERFLPIAPQPLAADKHIAKTVSKLGPGKAIPFPAGLAVISSGKSEKLLVANNYSDNAILLDAANGKQLASFDLSTHRVVPNSFPFTVVATRDGRRAWVSLWNTSRVAELDLIRGKVVRSIPLLEPKAPIDAGSHPTNLLLSQDEKLLYVALTNADSVAVVDTGKGSPRSLLSTRMPRQEYGGSMPGGLALSGDGKRLYVANAGTNTVAVFDVSGIHAAGGAPEGTERYALGFIPTEWYPLALAVHEGDLLIATGKGIGSGPNGEKAHPENQKRRKDFPYIPTLIHGSVARVNLQATEKELPELTKRAQENALLLADPGAIQFSGGTNPIRHVIYIIKENRTYDQIFGDLKVGDGDPSLTLYGHDITPNEHKLALQFGVLDNFYDSGEVSGDGHQWSTAAVASDYDEQTWQIGYRSQERPYDYEGVVNDESPLFNLQPDVAEPLTGYLWTNVARHNLTYRHYGEYVATLWCEAEPHKQAWPKQGTPAPPGGACSSTGITPGAPLPERLGEPKGSPSPYGWTIPLPRQNVPTKPELRGHFDPDFPDFEVTYPDQLRADEFLREFDGFVRARREGKKDGELPAYVLLRLPNDHTGGTKPGGPTPSASLADNDLAIGRVVDAVSHSPYWDDTAFFILEDDAQDGPDHVDAHRSIALVISKYSQGSVAQPFVDHTFYTTVSMLHTMEWLLGLPPMNHNDAYAPLMAPLFAGPGTQPAFNADYSNRDNGLIYKANMEKAPGAAESAAMDFSHADAPDAKRLNEILWRERKGDVPMPEARHTVIHADADDD
jgi:DNA-binding beta-propeller fold protein YncE